MSAIAARSCTFRSAQASARPSGFSSRTRSRSRAGTASARAQVTRQELPAAIELGVATTGPSTSWPRTVMPALQKAQPAPIGTGGSFASVEVPQQRRDTRIVKDMPVDEIAKEIVEWVKE